MNIDLTQLGMVIALAINIIFMFDAARKSERRLTMIEMDVKYIKRALDLTKRAEDE